jgi:ribose 5-phosphate isomerase RpiB
MRQRAQRLPDVPSKISQKGVANMRVGIATDHGGFGLKEELLGQLHAAGHEVVDFGANSLSEGDDYPDYVLPLAHTVVAGKVERGIAVAKVVSAESEGHGNFRAAESSRLV